MNYELVLSDEARLDIFEAFLWYEDQRAGLGLDFELCLEAGYISFLKEMQLGSLVFIIPAKTQWIGLKR